MDQPVADKENTTAAIDNLPQANKRYCAIVLTLEAQAKLVTATKQFYKAENWENALSPNGAARYAHHMTISYEHSLEDLNLLEGMELVITVIAIGETDKAMAVRLHKPIEQMTITPHISLAIIKGASRLNSNDITVWTEIPTFTLMGILRNDA